LNAIACAATTCWVVGGDRGQRRHHRHDRRGAVWTSQRFPGGLALSGTDVSSVFCAGRSACWALGNESNGLQIILASRR